MLFTKNSLSPVDFATLEVGSVAGATFTSFRYLREWVFGTFTADGHSVSAIIGSREEFPFELLRSLKGEEVQVEFTGTKVSNGITYPRYTINW